MTVASRATHRDMILNPLKWPQIHLPLVWRHEFSEVAIFCPGDNEISPTDPITVYLANQHSNWQNAPTKTYENVDALLDDGWVVD